MRDRYSNKNQLWELLDDEASLDIPRFDKISGRSREYHRPEQVKETLAEELEQPESEFNFTYNAGRHEQLWLGRSLASFYADNLISDILAIVKGGKEANVYCCQPNPNIGLSLLAAKVYRPRLLRNLKNDAMYKQGRELLGDDGKVMHDQRARRAVLRGSHKGKEMSIHSWIGHEYQAMSDLKAAGADVPTPVAMHDTTILMEYIGDAGLAAPLLQAVSLSKKEAGELFERLLWNVELMLSHDRIHADLSAFNVLYWEGQVKIIDFPQVVNPLTNKHGYALLRRDIERLCQYFSHFGLDASSAELAYDLWARYRRGEIGGSGRQIDPDYL
jgi:RIO kinase 1